MMSHRRNNPASLMSEVGASLADGANHFARVDAGAVTNSLSVAAAALVADWPELSPRQRSILQTLLGG